MTVTVSVAVLVGSVVDAAVMVTLPPLAGIPEGAVNVVATPLAVCAGEKVPQFPGVEQVTVQSTPAFAASPLTAATNLAVRFCTIVLLGTPWASLMEIGTTIVTFVVAVTTDGPAVAAAVAVIATAPGPNPNPFGGTVGGAVKAAERLYAMLQQQSPGSARSRGSTSP